MSINYVGGLNYALLKNFFDADDYAEVAFTATEDFYVVGLLAYVADTTVADIEAGWGLFAHGQTTAPIFLGGALFPGWVAEVPSFEAKALLFLADQDCYVRFGGPNRNQHLIPANTYMRFNRRCNIFFVERVLVDGELKCWLEG